MESLMDMDNTYGSMEPNIKVNFLMDSERVKEFGSAKMVINLQDTLVAIEKMVMENMSGQTETFIKDNFAKI